MTGVARSQAQPVRLDRELAMLNTLFTRPVEDAHLAPDLAWTEPLDPDEREEMRRELGAALIAAMLSNQWAEYDEAIDAWQATAAVLSDPELTARLMEDENPSEMAPLNRP